MAKSASIQLAVITPERQVVQAEASEVILPAHDGQLGVLRDRAPLMCELGVGTLRYTANGVSEQVFVDGGFAQVNDNVVQVLSPHALRSNEVNAAAVERAQRQFNATAEEKADADTRYRARRRVDALQKLQRAKR